LPECFLCKNPVYAHPGGSNGDNSNGDHSVNLNHDNENGLKTRGGWWIHDRCAHKLMALNRPTRCSDCQTALPSFDLYPYSGTISDAHYKKLACPNCGKPDVLMFEGFCFCGLPIFGRHEKVSKSFYYRYRSEQGEYWTGSIITYNLHPVVRCYRLLPHERPLRKKLFRAPKVVTERQFDWHPTRGWNCHHPDSGY
jgi:hypothetical protein